MTKTDSPQQTDDIKGTPCFTTKSGIKIGCMYEPPLGNHVTPEGEFWQRRLLKPSISPLPYTRDQLDEVVQAIAGIAFAFAILIVLFT
jgi:hypothetical protein